MSGKIPKDFIQQLIAKADLTDLVSHRIDLKRVGNIYKACCPFHQEKTPSFTVDSVKQFYYCFGCHAHGNAIDFLLQYDHLSFIEAIEELARLQGVDVPRSDAVIEPQESFDPLFKALEEANQFFQKQLRLPEVAKDAIEYLKQRGLNGETAKEFEIGFAPSGWHNLQAPLQSHGISEQRLLDAGLLVSGDKGNRYDRFRNRIMFPIRNRRGQTIGFGGRIIDPNDNPKYLNSPELPVFHKGRELYGLFEATKRLRKITRLLVVEGYMDVVSLAQFGIHNAVATLGTAVTADHLQKVFRICDEVVFSFDGDAAGYKAAWKALEISLPLLNGKRQAKFLFLPEKEDPDSFVRSQGTEQFEIALERAVPLSQFFWSHLSIELDLSSIDGRSKMVDLAKPLIQQIQNMPYREMMLQELALQVRLPNADLDKMIPNPKAAPPLPQSPPPKPRNKSMPSAIRSAIVQLLHQPTLGSTEKDYGFIQNLPDPGAALLAELITFTQEHHTLSTGGLLEHWRDHESGALLSKLAAQPLLLETNAEAQWSEFMQTLRKRSWEQQLETLKQKSRLGEVLSPQEQVEMIRLTQCLLQPKSFFSDINSDQNH